ncbi:MAG: hypothetical protein BGO55_06925 [Sphingobacteriales bacterium 50-39]|nr:hypothetical protein [Sphingobacteriales bacterium]OJW52984.1 MAG: hypothetical protein BGO55_06925 [Sphingobacteriales bacterium 50-39]
MYQLNDQQIDLILSDLRQRGIETESMRMNLLDHICILIENHLEENGDFGQFYATTIRSFYKEELRELEDEARLLMALNKGHLLLSRNQFFLLLFALLIGPFITYDLVWMVQTGPGWFIPAEIWVSTIVFALYPLLVLLVLFLTPDRFDPLIPHRAKILLGGRPLIRVMVMDTVQQ